MGYSVGRRYSQAFALPVVMISSVVMMMVLLSGLTAATSVNVGIRVQYEDKIKQAAAASGLAMAKDCIARNDNTITWTNATPLKPNTNCDGIEQFSCPTTTSDDKCFLMKSGTYRSKFSVGITTSATGETTINSQAMLYQMRQTSNTVLKLYTAQKKTTVNSRVAVAASSTPSLNANISNIVAGEQHACGVDVGGMAYCWGNNAYGQLGNGTNNSSSTPVAVQMPAGVTVKALTAGLAHTCALGSNGTVYCWGNNAIGQLGNNTIANASTPGAIWQGTVPNGVTLRDVSAGNYHTCATGSDGKAYCWGSNNNGQLGDGSTTDKRTPVTVFQGAVPANTALVKIGTGVSFTCAISEAGKAYCWGFNGSVQLGNSTSIANSSTPVAVSQGMIPATVTARTISVGSESACILGFNNKVYCWGNGAQGQLGYGNVTNQWAPVAVVDGNIPSTAVIQEISVGYYHACAVTSNDKAYCWGQNNVGQLGNGGSSNVSTPVAVSQGTTQFRNLAAGFQYTCGVTSDANAMCWGNNGSGRLGNGNTVNSSALVNVSVGTSQLPTTGMRTLDIGGTYGYDTACGISYEDKMYCWGYNGSGEFGNGNTTATTVPVNAFKAQGDIATKSVSIGGLSTCVMTTDNATCIGYNGYGQLGNGNTYDTGTPVVIAQGNRPAGVNFLKIKTKAFVTCGIGSNGKVYCWGNNASGQIGNGTTTNSSTPVAVAQGAMPVDTIASDIAPQEGNVCAIASDKKVYCWGRNDVGQLGNGGFANSYTPTALSQGAIPAGVTPKAIDSNCMLGSNAWVYCWGYNAYGMLGNGTGTNSSTPVALSRGAIPASVTITAIAAGGEGGHKCALGSDGKAYCWGYNNNGQLGNGTTTNSSTPVAVSQGAIPAGVTITKIAVGPGSTCAAASNLRVYCWGANGSSQLGNGGTAVSNTPTNVTQRISFRGSGSRVGSALDDSLLFIF